MKPKMKKLLMLLTDRQLCTSSYIAEQLGVSVRTVKTYIHDINEEYPDTISSGNSGYQIQNREQVYEILENGTDVLPQTTGERVTYIINRLLHENEKSLNIYDICDEIYVSASTIRNDLVKVKRALNKFDLHLESKGDFITCGGIEKNKRKLLSSMLYKESKINFINLESLQKSFLDIDIPFIRQNVLMVFDKYHYFINDYSLINLVLHITIAIDRIRHDNMNNKQINALPGVHLHEYGMAQEIASHLQQHFHITFSDAEIYEMTLLIISRATTIDYKSINTENLENFIGKECIRLVYQLIDDINAFYYIDLSEPEFLVRFALHIRNLLVRSENNYFSKNPLTENIKVSCPLIYDAAVNMARTIKEKMKVSISDDEIAYIALHLGSALEAQKDLTKKITAVLYCPNYYDLNAHIMKNISQHFDKKLLITNILTEEGQLKKIKDMDLIISVLPLSFSPSVPSLIINPFLPPKDRELLHETIAQIQKTKKQNEFEKHLRKLISLEFFERKNGLSNEKECIDYMVKKLIKKNYVEPSFKKEILEREQLSSTAFGNFAIPHAMKMYAKKTAVNILISDDAISWNHHPVNLVMMMCFNKSERHIFNEIYEPITMILSEPENVRKILAAKDYEEFIRIFSSLYAF